MNAVSKLGAATADGDEIFILGAFREALGEFPGIEFKPLTDVPASTAGGHLIHRSFNKAFQLRLDVCWHKPSSTASNCGSIDKAPVMRLGFLNLGPAFGL